MSDRSPDSTPSLGPIGRLQETVSQFFHPIAFRAVETTGELTHACRLVYEEYLKRTYIAPNPWQMKLSLYQALPSTTTFLAVHQHHGLVGTVTLVEDSPLGLPMDEVYKAELDEMRRQGLRLAEATMLALRSDLFGTGVFTMFHSKKLMLTLRLFKVMFDYLRSCTQADELVACFNPKHQMLYDFLSLKPLGGLKTYPGANSHPAIAKHLNVAQTRQQATATAPYKLFYGSTPSASDFTKKLRLSAADLLQLFIRETPILASASPTELAYVKQCYPSYPIQEMLRDDLSHQPPVLKPFQQP